MVNSALANDTIIVIDNNKVMDISPFLLIHEDKSNDLSFEDILSKEFISTNKKVPNLGISKSTFWIKIPITNLTTLEHFLLDVSVPTIDFVELYFLDVNNHYSKIEMGEHMPFNSRKYDDPDYVFDVFISPGQFKVFYLKIQSNEGIQLPIKIGSEVSILNQLKNKGILSGVYFGIMLVMILYNLFIYFSVRDKSYLYYVVYIIFTLFTQFSLQGYPFQYFWPNYPIIAAYSLFIFPALVGVAGIVFMKAFLDVKRHNLLLHRISYVLYIPYIVSIGCLFIQNFKISQMIMEINAMVVSVYMLITPIVILKKGYQPAKFFLVAWSVFLIGVCIYILKDLEILPFNNFTRYTMQIGSAIETIL
ncbi:MAG: 7TMR-DISM family protein, partial [Nitrososphaeraceae archaeon]